jgi:cytochrome c-type biogenesis protein CcmH
MRRERGKAGVLGAHGRAVLAAGAVLLCLAAGPTAAQESLGDPGDLYQAQRDVAGKLICQCGCQMVLRDCTHENCPSRPGMLAEIDRRLRAGEDEQTILDAFVAEYGLKVLAAPPTRGFNLTVWMAPFAALLVGGIVVFVFVKRWLRTAPAEAETFAPTEEDEKYLRQAEKELASYRGGAEGGAG